MSLAPSLNLVARGAQVADEELRAAARAFAGAGGWMVRCTPRRWVVRTALASGGLVFAKLRVGRWADAVREWAWLEGAGPPLRLPAPVGLFRRGRRSLLALRAAPGRPVQALLAESEPVRITAYVETRIAPVVARLHGAGWVYRDLYWNHLFAESLDEDPTWIDVERAFRPRFRHRRWREKDLAGLVSSADPPLPDEALEGLLGAYELAAGRPVDRRAITARAARVRSRRPRFG